MDIAEMAVSREEFRPMVLIDPLDAVATGPSMAGLRGFPVGLATGGFEFTGSETLRVSFVALGEKLKLRNGIGLAFRGLLAKGQRGRTNPGTSSSGLEASDESE